MSGIYYQNNDLVELNSTRFFLFMKVCFSQMQKNVLFKLFEST